MRYRYNSEPPLEPPDDGIIVTLDCGCEAYVGDLVFIWQGLDICDECFREKLSEMKLEDIAFDLGITTKRISAD